MWRVWTEISDGALLAVAIATTGIGADRLYLYLTNLMYRHR